MNLALTAEDMNHVDREGKDVKRLWKRNIHAADEFRDVVADEVIQIKYTREPTGLAKPLKLVESDHSYGT